MAAIFLVGVMWPGAPPAGRDAVEPGGLEPSALWLVPESPVSAAPALGKAVSDLNAGQAARALPLLQRAASSDDLGGYGLLYLGRAQLALHQLDAARRTADRLLARHPPGYLSDAAFWLSVDVATTAEDWRAAVGALRALLASDPLDSDRARLRLGQLAAKAGDTTLAVESLRAVYFDAPLSPHAAEAATELAALGASLVPTASDDLARHRARAEQLFAAGRYADARTAFVGLRRVSAPGERALIDFRLAVSDYFLKRYASARSALGPIAASRPEAEMMYFSTLREMGQHGEYVRRARAFVEAHPADPLAEQTLDDLGTHFILVDEDAKAADVFAELYSRFPHGPHADRAAWKAGWWRFRQGDYAEAIRLFESAATRFPRNDYRPSWLYWAARAHERLGHADQAAAAFQRVIADYRYSYYGRLSARAMAGGRPGIDPPSDAGAVALSLEPGDPPSNAAVIRGLLAAGLYDDAIMELRKVERECGSSPLLDATTAYALNRKGDLRAGIIRMRRAYPQFLADGGEQLPEDIRRVIFPVAYWDLIARYAAQQKLDPYVMAALIAQESTFQAEVRSRAGAWGLMQILPSTGRQVAARLGIRPFSTTRLKQPEINIRIGMAAFAGRVAKYGSLAPALAAYNAGDSRVTRWLAERPGLPQDEFIDDIPFPETRNYVKRILGTAEDYRALYPGLAPAAAGKTAGAAPVRK